MAGGSRRGVHSFRKRQRTPARVSIQPHEGERTLAQIETQSRTARTNWFGLLAYLAFVGVTLLGVEDADFFVSTRQTQLPLVGVSIPTLAFFWTAPLLGAALYVYLHLHLMTLWHALARAPAEIDGKPLGERVFPWLVNDLALSARRDKPLRTQPLRWLANLVTIALVWVAGPAVLFGFWWRSMPAHEFAMTMLISACLLVSLFVGVSSAVTFWQVIPLEKEHARPWRPMWRTALAGLVAVVVLFYGAARSHYGDRIEPVANATVDWIEAWTGPWFRDVVDESRWTRRSAQDVQEAWVRDRIGLASADLFEVELVPKPDDWRSRVVAQRRFRADWCERQGIPAVVCGETGVEHDVDAAALDAQRSAWCATAPHVTRKSGDDEVDTRKGLTCARFFTRLDERFLEEWKEERQGQLDALPPLDLSGRDLRNADAIGAFLANADLRYANLETADLRDVNLEGVVLWRAHLEAAILADSHLQGASLGSSHLKGATLAGANLEGAELHSTHLEGAAFGSANLKGATFGRARLEGTDFRYANLKGAYLGHSSLLGADLRSARLEGAELWRASLAHALVHRADFTGAFGLTQNQLDMVLGSHSTKLPADEDTGRPLHVWSCWAEPPPHFDDLVTRLSYGDQERAKALRAEFLCPPGTEPECRGTYVSPDGVVGEPGSSCPDRSP